MLLEKSDCKPQPHNSIKVPCNVQINLKKVIKLREKILRLFEHKFYSIAGVFCWCTSLPKKSNHQYQLIIPAKKLALERLKLPWLWATSLSLQCLDMHRCLTAVFSLPRLHFRYSSLTELYKQLLGINTNKNVLFRWNYLTSK